MADSAKPVIARYNGESIPVEDPSLTPAEFGEVLAEEWPELSNCRVTTRETDDSTFWDYSVVSGNKG